MPIAAMPAAAMANQPTGVSASTTPKVAMAPVSDTSAAISGPPSSTPMATSSVSNPPKRSITGASTEDTRVNIASIRASAPGVSSVPTTNWRTASKARVMPAPICCAHWSKRPSVFILSIQAKTSLNWS